MSRKLLLADDSITIQKVVGIIFANEDCDLAVVSDGDSALAAARSDRPDLIMADAIMPGKNGYELCSAIRQDPGLRDVPVLLLSGSFEPFDEDRARDAGIDDWIVKPFESQALLDKVEALLARGPRLAPPSAVSNVPAIPEFDDGFAGQATVADADMWQELEGADFAPVPDLTADEAGDLEPDLLDIADSFPADDEDLAAYSELPADEPHDIFASAPASAAGGEGEDDFLAQDDADDEGILFLDEDDILCEELTDDELAAERASDLAFESESELSWDAGEATASSSEAAAEISEAPEPVFSEPEPVFEAEPAAPVEDEVPSRDGLSFFQNAGLVEKLSQPAAASAATETTAPVSEPPDAGLDAEAAPTDEMVGDGSGFVPSATEIEAQVRGISEEDLSRIVEKVAAGVIERLADTILERIAWEVVPDLAESMIRDEIRRITEKV
jgi:CheY-like chemotaxis protein